MHVIKRCPDDGQEFDLDACACDVCFGALGFWCAQCRGWLVEGGCSKCGAVLAQPASPQGLEMNTFLVSALHGTRDAIVRHFTPSSVCAMVGSGMYAYMGTSSGANLTTLALTSDCIRTAIDAVNADGQIAVQEVCLIHPFLKTAAAFYANYRNVYRSFTNLKLDGISDFLAFFQADKGPFGYGHKATLWGGLAICANVAALVHDAEPLDRYEHLITELATQLVSLGGVTQQERLLVQEIKTRIGNAKARIPY